MAEIRTLLLRNSFRIIFFPRSYLNKKKPTLYRPSWAQQPKWGQRLPFCICIKKGGWTPNQTRRGATFSLSGGQIQANSPRGGVTMIAAYDSTGMGEGRTLRTRRQCDLWSAVENSGGKRRVGICNVGRSALDGAMKIRKQQNEASQRKISVYGMGQHELPSIQIYINKHAYDRSESPSSS